MRKNKERMETGEAERQSKGGGLVRVKKTSGEENSERWTKRKRGKENVISSWNNLSFIRTERERLVVLVISFCVFCVVVAVSYIHTDTYYSV